MSKRQDTATVKRVELHLHTRFSTMDSLIDPEALVRRAAEWGMDAVAVTDVGGALAFPYLWQAGKKYGVKIIYGVETVIADEVDREYTACLLAKDRTGLKHLYELISLSYDHYRHHLPSVPQSALLVRREGLLIGAADASDAERMPELFDYIEIRPTDSEAEGLDAARIAQALGKPLVAVSDARFLEPEDELARRVLLSGQKNGDNARSAPLYLRATDEMLTELSYLGEADCHAAVVDNPRAIAAQCEKIELLPDRVLPPTLDGSAEELKSAVYGRLAALYGENPPVPIRERVNRELDAILAHGYDALFVALARIAEQSREKGYAILPRNEVGASLVAYLSGITEINPLGAHYRCPKCVYTEFVPEKHCGADLPDKRCPDCGAPLDRDGFDIPSSIASIVSQNDRAMQISLNCAAEYCLNAAIHAEEVFGAEHICRVGRVGFLPEKTAASLVDRFCEQQSTQLPEQERQRVIGLCVGAKRDAGVKPYSLFIVPQNMSVADICPTWRDERDERGEYTAAQFEYSFLRSCLPRIDIVTYDAFDELHAMEDANGVPSSNIPLNDPSTLSLLFSEAFWDDLEQMPDMRVLRLRGEMMRQLLRETKPKDFDDLIRLFGLSLSTNGWRGNAETLIKEGTATLKEVITCREDILRDLTSRDVPYDIACEIMSAAGKGQIKAGKIPLRWGEEMHRTRTPPWYVRSMINAGYFFSRAQAVCDALTAYRFAWGWSYNIEHELHA